jgi:uracil-DNA glycosylase
MTKLVKIFSKEWVEYIDLSELSQISLFLDKERKQFKDICEVYPPNNNIFSAFTYFKPEDTKVIIIGQDPYHGKGQAMGLSFSVPNSVKIPPSLRNIFKELKTDLDSDKIYYNGDLTSWAKQGVLLLNRALTVLQAKPNSHQKKWSDFTLTIISKLLAKNSGIVLMLWGGNAKAILKSIDSSILSNHYILQANHPSPLSANRGGWFGNRHFSKANQFLAESGKSQVDWSSIAKAIDKN